MVERPPFERGRHSFKSGRGRMSWFKFVEAQKSYYGGPKDDLLLYKIIPYENLEQLGLLNLKFAKINKKDPLIRSNNFLKVGDLIAIYRDYQYKVTPYYALRIVNE